MKRFLFLFVSIHFFLFSCTKEDSPVEPQEPGQEEPPPVDLPERSITDTAYGTNPLQKMDIYLPASRNDSTQTVVFIHGGGWSEGSKDDLTQGIVQLRTILPDYAFVNINYRLAANGTNTFPAQENDVKAAVAFLLANTDSFHISRDLVLAGFSAGAHLALLHSYKNDTGKNVKAIVDFFGPTDLPALWNTGATQQVILWNAIGKLYTDDPALYTSSTPINYITAQSAPTIILQGGKDDLVPPAQANLLAAKLQEKGVVHEVVVYPNEGHGWQGNNLLDSFNKIKAFISANVPK